MRATRVSPSCTIPVRNSASRIYSGQGTVAYYAFTDSTIDTTGTGEEHCMFYQRSLEIERRLETTLDLIRSGEY